MTAADDRETILWRASVEQRLSAIDTTVLRQGEETRGSLAELRGSIDTLVMAMGGRGGATVHARRLVKDAVALVTPAPLFVLIVEDDVSMQKLYHRIFGDRADLNIRTTVSAGREFIFEHGARIDLLILDYALPDGDGLDVLQSMRGISGGHHVPVLVVSAYGADIEQAARKVSGRGRCDVFDKLEIADHLRERLNNGGFTDGAHGSRERQT